MKPELTQAELKKMLDYDADTGLFSSKLAHAKMKVGSIAGTRTVKGYINISINGKVYLGHRLAFLYMTGELPAGQVDHISHTKADYKWSNLREVSHQQNQCNRGKCPRNTSGINGVIWDKQISKWRAQIMINGKNKSLGAFSDKTDAALARKDADTRYGFHENHGVC